MILLPHFTRSLVARSVFIWLILRAWATGGSMTAAEMLGVPPPAHPLLLSARAVLLLLAIVTAAGWMYARRRNEDRFLLCLGYGQARLLGTLFLPVALLESAIAIAVLS